jgi:TRAP-type transport system periplasmic protein
LPLVSNCRAAAQQFNFRPGHPLTAALVENLKKHSGGRISVTVFPSDQLGAQADAGEVVRQGTSVIQLTDALFLGQYMADAEILQATYLMQAPEDFRRILGTPRLANLNDRLPARDWRADPAHCAPGPRPDVAELRARARAIEGGRSLESLT